jgi:P pilus assembly chaperone PapD
MKYKFLTTLLASCLALLINISCIAQAGISVSPARVYFNSSAKGLKSQKIVISNPSDKPIEIGVSVNDWNYDTLGNNKIYDAGKLQTSGANAIKIIPGSYFTLKPNEQKEVTVQFNAAGLKKTSASFNNAMIFFTQLNPGQPEKANGASIKVTVRMGVKVYYASNPDEPAMLDIVNLKDVSASTKSLALVLHNNGKIWADGKCKWELLNTATGIKTPLEEDGFFTLPGDKRIITHALPSTLPKGKYTATTVVSFGKNKEIKVAELEFVL